MPVPFVVVLAFAQIKPARINLSLFGMGLTCAIFLASYGGYFLVTYLMSTGIVRAAIATHYSE